MKTYLVSEELLRQVLGAFSEASWFLPDDSTAGMSCEVANKALRTLLAKEPSEPIAWMQNKTGCLRHDEKFDTSNWTPLYRKDA